MLKESIGASVCRSICVLTCVSSSLERYYDTLNALQMANRLQKIKTKTIKVRCCNAYVTNQLSCSPASAVIIRVSRTDVVEEVVDSHRVLPAIPNAQAVRNSRAPKRLYFSVPLRSLRSGRHLMQRKVRLIRQQRRSHHEWVRWRQDETSHRSKLGSMDQKRIFHRRCVNVHR